jgi:hypothetical protein
LSKLLGFRWFNRFEIEKGRALEMPKTEVFRVRVTEAERAALDARAAELSVSPSTLLRSGVRQMIAAPDLMAEDREAMRDGFRVLRGAATNLNQLAKWANQGRDGLGPDVVDGMKDLRAEVEALRAAFSAYLMAEKRRGLVLTSPDREAV